MSARRGFTLLLALWLPAAGAGELTATVFDAGGEPVADAVVYAVPAEGVSGEHTAEPALIDQVDKEFVPSVTAVYRGARVSFPNNDNIRHHVYSFSRGNAFEIPLYADEAAPPVTFDKPGVVALGCNVHDWMSAHVFVSETPWFAVTGAEGTARIESLPPGDYAVEVWHRRLKGDPSRLRQRLTVGAEETAEVAFSIEQKRVWKAWRGSSDFGEGY